MCKGIHIQDAAANRKLAGFINKISLFKITGMQELLQEFTIEFFAFLYHKRIGR